MFYFHSYPFFESPLQSATATEEDRAIIVAFLPFAWAFLSGFLLGAFINLQFQKLLSSTQETPVPSVESLEAPMASPHKEELFIFDAVSSLDDLPPWDIVFDAVSSFDEDNEDNEDDEEVMDLPPSEIAFDAQDPDLIPLDRDMVREKKWWANFENAKCFYDENHHLDIPQRGDEVHRKLYKWLYNQRSNLMKKDIGSLNGEKKKRYEALHKLLNN